MFYMFESIRVMRLITGISGPKGGHYEEKRYIYAQVIITLLSLLWYAQLL